jgi:electron transfer flavoprotein alpha subunit
VTVLCLVELDGSGAADASLRALTFARGLASLPGPGPAGPAGPVPPGGPAGPAGPLGSGEGGVAAVLFGEAADVPGEVLAAYGVSGCYLTEPGRLAGYAPLAWARTLAELIARTGASAVVAAATDRGNEVMAHLGALTGQPMAANTVSAEQAGAGSYRIVRQRWAGLLLEDAALEAPVALLTVATDAVPASPADAPATLAVHVHEPELADGDLLVCASESAGQSGGISLASARVVVGGGRGVGSAEGFAPLEELAALLGGVVGVSRVVTSEGWRPHRQQVGQTGTKITPELYLACGISGAIQHIAGCASAKHIVAVNKDSGAPILAHAEYAVIGDLHEVIPALVTAIRDRGASSP